MNKCRPRPIDKQLYARISTDVKSSVQRWPSAYASGLVVQRYKAAGGKYSCTKARGGLTKWFREKWVNVCNADLPVCGRQGEFTSEAAYRKAYPKCRPLRTAKAMSPAERKRACARKRRVVRSQPERSKKVVWVT